jgi:hypothetical protein
MLYACRTDQPARLSGTAGHCQAASAMAEGTCTMRSVGLAALLCAAGLAGALMRDATAQVQPCPDAVTGEVKVRTASTLKIQIFEEGASVATISIPLSLAKAASKLMPKQMQGVSMDEVLKLAETPPENGILLQLEDHLEKSRLVISVVAD